MTIREYIVRRVNLCRGVVVVWMIGISTCAVMYSADWHGPGAGGGSWRRLLPRWRLQA